MPSQTVPETGLPAEARGLIGHQLREAYRRVLAEPLPDKFTKLLEELARSESQSESKPESNE
ncbi:MAG: NepR family anti-sigma factor [Hyphomicrobiaceae bacterium]